MNSCLDLLFTTPRNRTKKTSSQCSVIFSKEGVELNVIIGVLGYFYSKEFHYTCKARDRQRKSERGRKREGVWGGEKKGKEGERKKERGR